MRAKKETITATSVLNKIVTICDSQIDMFSRDICLMVSNAVISDADTMVTYINVLTTGFVAGSFMVCPKFQFVV